MSASLRSAARSREVEPSRSGAATTDPRKPDYANLFAMRGVDWDDPTVAELSAQRNQHPVETRIDLMLANEGQVFVQPLATPPAAPQQETAAVAPSPIQLDEIDLDIPTFLRRQRGG